MTVRSVGPATWRLNRDVWVDGTVWTVVGSGERVGGWARMAHSVDLGCGAEVVVAVVLAVLSQSCV
jgi:hypothetical protein